jgi:hypothetical protein
LPSIYTYSEREEKQAGTLRKEGNICGIYIPGHHHIEINMDVTFDEDAMLKKLRR